LRCAWWALNPPNNAFDDHLEVVAHVARTFQSPDPASCWECYQPPLYYWLAAVVLRLTWWITHSYWAGWKAVQALSAAASTAALCLAFSIVRVGTANSAARIIGYAVLAFLPVDILTSSFVANDSFVQLLVTLAVYAYLRLRSNEPYAWQWAIVLGVAVAAAAWTKQSGLVAITLLPLAAYEIIKRCSPTPRRTIGLLAIATGTVLAIAQPLYRFAETGDFFLSNQRFFDWAQHQQPGTLSLALFTTLQPVALWVTPTLDSSTVGSFWTEVFARTWFDYEPKFTSLTALTTAVARFSYACGIGWCVLAAIGLWLMITRRALRTHSNVAVVAMLALCVSIPIAQTVRFPYFSSMKPNFALPGTAGLGFLVALGSSLFSGRVRTLALMLVAGQLVACLGQFVAAYVTLPLALGRGPLWPFPPLW